MENAVVHQMSPIKSVSPTKKFSKSGNKTLIEMEILENLDLDDEFDNRTNVDAKKPPKTFQTGIPTEMTKTRHDEKVHYMEECRDAITQEGEHVPMGHYLDVTADISTCPRSSTPPRR